LENKNLSIAYNLSNKSAKKILQSDSSSSTYLIHYVFWNTVYVAMAKRNQTVLSRTSPVIEVISNQISSEMGKTAIFNSISSFT